MSSSTAMTVDPHYLKSLGFNVIPVREKRPLIEWQKYQTLPVGNKEIDEWNAAFPGCDWGIVTGKISNLLVLDVDDVEAFAAVGAHTVVNTWKTATKKGHHYYFKWEEAYAAFPTTKVQVLPGADTRGNGGYVVAYDFVQGCSPTDLPLAPCPRWLVNALSRVAYQEGKAYRPGWIQEALNNTEKGNRTHTFARIIGKLNRDGWDDADIFALLKPHADDYDFDPIKLQDQILDMTTRYQEQAQVPVKSGCSAAELLSGSSPSLSWTVGHILPEKGIGILASAPGYGKSWLLLDLAVSVSLGRAWLGRYSTKVGKVLYVDEESTKDLLRFRLKKLLKATSTNVSDLQIDFHIGQGLSLTDPQSLEMFRQKIDAARPSLVIIDSFIRCHRAEENNATALSQVFGNVKQITRDFGCAVMFADHLRKPSAFNSSPEQEFRGSTEKLAAIDAGFLLHRMGEGVMLEQAKARYEQQIKPVELKIVDVGQDATEIRVIG